MWAERGKIADEATSMSVNRSRLEQFHNDQTLKSNATSGFTWNYTSLHKASFRE